MTLHSLATPGPRQAETPTRPGPAPRCHGIRHEDSCRPRMPPVYVKLQLGAGKIIGRSCHYSEPEELKDDDR